jgi:ABC-2 type transport system ATP-binding protein
MTAVDCNYVSKHFASWKRADLKGTQGFTSRIRAFFCFERSLHYAVKEINFQVQEGEIFGILGTNGSGKSTLIRIISTLLIPDSGSVKVFGHDVVEEEGAVRRIINRVSVEASFFKKLSAWENLSYTARLYGLNPVDSKKKMLTIMERLGFSKEKMGDSLENLSRGMQQKVSIARALLTEPSLLLLDEPTTGLDPRSKRQVQEFVSEMNRERGITTILTTHDMEEADRLCHRIGIMREGQCIALGTPEELKEMKQLRGSDGESPVTLEEVFLKLAEEQAGD